MIPREVIEDIRKNSDIVQVVSSRINVIKKGNGYVAVCPFHNDTNPSMMINKEMQIFKCFACNKGGNVFTFIADYDKCSFQESVIKVAELINYKSDLLKKPERVVDTSTKSILNCLKQVNELYKMALKTEDGLMAKEYFDTRHIDEEMQEYFQLGYSSSNPEITIKLLQNMNIDLDIISKAGILLRQRGLYLDRFSNRVTFPIFNEFSEIVGFSARIIQKSEEAKYLNSPNTEVFNKSNILYNYQNAKIEAKREGYVYVVEGFMDVFALYKAGIKSSVALMGTAFTSFHAKLLKRLGVEVRLCLDGDDAGQRGMLEMINLLDQENISYSIVNYKDCTLDPDEILQKYGPDKLNRFLLRTFDKYSFIIDYFSKRISLDTFENKKRFIKELVPYISKITNKLDREMMISRVAELTNVSQDSIASQLYNTISTKDLNFRKDITIKEQRKVLSRIQRIERQVMYLILTFPESLSDFKNTGDFFIDQIYRTIYNALEDYVIDNKYNISDFISFITSNEKIDKHILEVITDLLEAKDLKQLFKNYERETLVQPIKIKQDDIKKNTIKKEIETKIQNAQTNQEKAQILQDIFESKKGE